MRNRVKKSFFIVLLILGTVLATMIFSFLYFNTSEDMGLDYSDRYYELLNKGALTRKERDELEKEENRVQAEAIDQWKQ